MGRWLAAAVAVLASAACGPQMDGLQSAGEGEVARAADPDTLVLASGAEVTLAGLYGFEKQGWLEEAEFRAHRDRAEAARAALERLTQGRTARLAHPEGAPTRTQLFVQSEGGRWIWVQEALLREGSAFAAPTAADGARGRRLLAAEAQAREEGRGLWSEKAHAVREAGRAGSIAVGRFQIVEGRVESVAVRERYAYLNFGDDYATDFSARVPADALAAWPGGVAAVEGLGGADVRVRGFVFESGGPMMEITDPGAIETIGKAAA